MKEIEKAHQRAKEDLEPFREFVYTIERQFKGSHAKVGMKLPSPGSKEQHEQYQQQMFKVLIRIFEKMFRELANER